MPRVSDGGPKDPAGFIASRGWPRPPVNLRPGGDGGDNWLGRSNGTGFGGVRGMKSSPGPGPALSMAAGIKLLDVRERVGVRGSGCSIPSDGD
jgi:hypothetical protein